MTETVLVTGGTGFVAGWTIVRLLDRGYAVRTTIRDASKEAEVRAAVATGLRDAGFGAAVATGRDATQHDLVESVGGRGARAGAREAAATSPSAAVGMQPDGGPVTGSPDSNGVMERLTFHVADLTADGGWQTAMAGCDYVLHVASPLGGDGRETAEALVGPAREGTLRVLRAAVAAGVQR